MSKLLEANGLTEADLLPQTTTEEVAEYAYLMAEYNNILILMMMEE